MNPTPEREHFPAAGGREHFPAAGGREHFPAAGGPSPWRPDPEEKAGDPRLLAAVQEYLAELEAGLAVAARRDRVASPRQRGGTRAQ